MDTRVFKPKNKESGTLTQTLLVAEVNTAYVSPVPENAPGVIVLSPGTVNEEHLYYKNRNVGAGTITGLTRDYTNLNGGVGFEHNNGSSWETMQAAEYIKNIVDALMEGYTQEQETIAYVSGTQFTVKTDKTSFYTKGRITRFNQDNTKIATVVSSSYSAGTDLTTVIVENGTVPTPLTHVEGGIFPKSGADLLALSKSVQSGSYIYAADSGASDAYAITLSPAPAAYVAGMAIAFKANTANTGQATLDINGLGAKTIKKNYNEDLADNDIKAGSIVTVVYDGTNFQVQSVSGGGAAFWTIVPGSPTRISDTQFTIPDVGNALKLDLLFKKGVILKWDEAGTINVGMVISSSYATDVVTINIVGDSLSIGFTGMKYCLQMANVETFIIPGTLGAATDIAKTWYTPQGIILLSADAYVKTAGTTNPTVFDINDDGVTKFTTKPSIASAATSDIDNTADAPTTEIAVGSLVTVDIDSVSTTPPVEAYLYLFYFPTSWLYRS